MTMKPVAAAAMSIASSTAKILSPTRSNITLFHCLEKTHFLATFSRIRVSAPYTTTALHSRISPRVISPLSPFKGRAFVSYYSPHGTPFYYPGEGFADLGIGPEKLLNPGDPDTYQVKIRDVMPVGYFVDMPNGREGYLPANDLGFSGGIERLRTIFQVGQEVTVRITFRCPGGRELLSIRKYDPDRPPIEPPKVARSSGSGKRKISAMMRRRAQQQQQQNNSN